MQDADLLVLLDEPHAVRLLLAWQRVSVVPGMTETEVVDEWSRAAGVDLFTTRRLAPVLLGARLCLDGGRLDPLALRTAQAVTAKRLAPLTGRE